MLPGKTICQHNLYTGQVEADTQGSESRCCHHHLSSTIDEALNPDKKHEF